ncbi:MAG: SUMF1/EgtB/PvdO family nonheme iron enzyme [Acidobacteria bacterium]|nr:SUMF1/EgtB/PvdO family nonheme iron enzyme [Candidatus Sulfomarinibacter sp. MAG AM2]
MSILLTIEVGEERHVYSSEDLPLSVGGTACHVVLPGLSDDGPVAYLGQEGGELFIQPAENVVAATPVTCNGVPLTASRWLGDGDEVGVGRHRLRCRTTGDTVRLALIQPATRPDADPAAGVSPPSPIVAPERAITPTDFQPRWQSPPPRSRFSVRPRSLVLMAAIVLLAAGAWFVLTARAVRVETIPTAESLEIRGGWLTPKIGGSYLLRPGTYTVAAELTGYRSLTAPLEIDGDTPSVVAFTFEPLGGLLTITSRPVDGAEISIDGASFGATPADDIELGAGEHTVEIKAPLHLPYRTTLRFEPGDPPRELAVELVPNWAQITVTTSRAGATVSLEGTVLGSTPLQHRVEAGERVIEIYRPGFKPLSRRLQVTAGEPVDLGSLQLVPVDGRLAVASDPTGASVTVNGVFRGTAPLELDLAPGSRYEVKVSAAGHATFTTEVEISSGRRSEVRTELEILVGEVRFTSLPPRAELLIDGVPSGTTDQTVKLEARPHRIEVRLEGYVPFQTILTPEPGLPQTVQATLKEAGPAGLPTSVESPQGVELVLVGPGRFTMGAARREPGRRANEVLREVEITRPFYLSVREVTNREYREFRSEHRSGSVGNYNLEIDHHPVVNITWNDAAKYCNWLSEQAGLPPVYVERGGAMVARTPFPQGFRLPTEVEWAWATRYPNSANARKYGWGDSLPVPADAGNYGDTAGASVLGGAIPGYSDNYGATAPSGSFPPNPLGLYNLGGNVSEWMNDIYAVTPSPPNEVARDPTGPSEGAYHVIRGASWMDTNLTELRLSYRDYDDRARPDLGFRIARSAQ